MHYTHLVKKCSRNEITAQKKLLGTPIIYGIIQLFKREVRFTNAIFTNSSSWMKNKPFREKEILHKWAAFCKRFGFPNNFISPGRLFQRLRTEIRGNFVFEWLWIGIPMYTTERSGCIKFEIVWKFNSLDKQNGLRVIAARNF